ncbi:MAG: hypothetical protein MI755_13860 [Sphingomonadales bacterium]|nr:hypothetical protein [Sphingomonadales bacterium]
MAYLTERRIGYKRVVETASLDQAITIKTGQAPAIKPDREALKTTLERAGYPERADSETVQPLKAILIITAMTLLSAITYGPAAALLVEMFPANMRYTSISIPYHFGAGYVGGFLPLLLVIETGSIYAELYYTIGVPIIALAVSLAFLPETKDRDMMV